MIRGTFLWVPVISIDYSILGSMFGVPLFWETTI